MMNPLGSAFNGSDTALLGIDARASERAARAAMTRASSGRRRRIDPTTCERTYTTDELEFMDAMHRYKMSSGRMFPTWSEVLEVVKDLGYHR